MIYDGVDADVGLESVANPSSLWVLARRVHCVDDGARESGVTENRLVVHEPDVDEAAVGVNGVVGVLGILLKNVNSVFFWCHLEPLQSLV